MKIAILLPQKQHNWYNDYTSEYMNIILWMHFRLYYNKVCSHLNYVTYKYRIKWRSQSSLKKRLASSGSWTRVLSLAIAFSTELLKPLMNISKFSNACYAFMMQYFLLGILRGLLITQFSKILYKTGITISIQRWLTT